jgi:acetolactate synthase-1/2/3 large subunit
VDVLAAEVPEVQRKSSSSSGIAGTDRAAGDAECIRQAVAMLSNAQRPLIVAGSGTFYAGGGGTLLQFARLAGIPVVTPIWDRGVVDPPTDEFLGAIGAASGEPRLLEDVDVMVMAGARVDYRIRYGDSPPLDPGLRVIRIDLDAAELHNGMQPDVAILADSRTAFEQLTDAWEEGGGGCYAGWLAEARDRHRAFYGHWSDMPEYGSGLMTGGRLVEALKPVITDDTLFLIDGGNIGQWAHMMLCHSRYPSHWLTCGASGLVGWGVPGAMAARLTFPDRPVLLLSGDGALGFGLAEFESAARQRIPFVAVVADDSAWGIVVSGQRRSQGPIVASELGPADYAGAAVALGARGVRVETPDLIAPAVRGAYESGEPTLIHVPIRRGGPSD